MGPCTKGLGVGSFWGSRVSWGCIEGRRRIGDLRDCFSPNPISFFLLLLVLCVVSIEYWGVWREQHTQDPIQLQNNVGLRPHHEVLLVSTVTYDNFFLAFIWPCSSPPLFIFTVAHCDATVTTNTWVRKCDTKRDAKVTVCDDESHQMF